MLQSFMILGYNSFKSLLWYTQQADLIAHACCLIRVLFVKTFQLAVLYNFEWLYPLSPISHLSPRQSSKITKKLWWTNTMDHSTQFVFLILCSSLYRFFLLNVVFYVACLNFSRVVCNFLVILHFDYNLRLLLCFIFYI